MFCNEVEVQVCLMEYYCDVGIDSGSDFGYQVYYDVYNSVVVDYWKTYFIVMEVEVRFYVVESGIDVFYWIFVEVVLLMSIEIDLVM